MGRARAILRGKNPESELLRASDADFLKGLGAMRAGQVTHTGLLLFGQQEMLSAHCPQAQVHYVHQPSDTAAARNDQWRVGLLLALERIEQIFSGPANPEEELPVGLFKLRVPAFPLDSVREAVLNALTHRDYSDPGEVLIRHTPREVVVTSPGGFIGGITVENFLSHEPVARNRTLADALVRLRLVEAAGMGRRRMWVQSLSFGKPAPRLGSDGHRVTLRLLNTGYDAAMAALVSRLNQQGVDVGLNTLLVLSYLRDHPYVDAEEAARLFQVDIAEARGMLDEIGASGTALLERKSHTRSATFHLAKGIARELLGKAAYTKSRGLNPIRYAEMVREYLHDQATVTNREVRELLGLGESATAQVEASRLLRRWSSKDGFLVKDGNGAKRCYRLKIGT
jgi:ATP-dependent DNA helicase RecG